MSLSPAHDRELYSPACAARSVAASPEPAAADRDARRGAGVVAAAFAVPLLRRRRGIPADATVAPARRGRWLWRSCGRAPRRGTSALRAPDVGASRWPTSFPTTTPTDCDALRDPLPDRRRPADRLGRLPNARLAAGAERPGEVTRSTASRSSTGSGSSSRTLRSAFVQARHTTASPARPASSRPPTTSDASLYFAVPTAPPWWAPRTATEAGRAARRDVSGQVVEDPQVRRIMMDVGEGVWGQRMAGPLRLAWRKPLGGDAFASLRDLADGGDPAGRVGARGRRASAAATRGARLRARLPRRALPVDLPAGAALVALVRRGEPLAEPVVLAVNRGLQLLEGIADSDNR